MGAYNTLKYYITPCFIKTTPLILYYIFAKLWTILISSTYGRKCTFLYYEKLLHTLEIFFVDNYLLIPSPNRIQNTAINNQASACAR